MVLLTTNADELIMVKNDRPVHTKSIENNKGADMTIGGEQHTDSLARSALSVYTPINEHCRSLDFSIMSIGGSVRMYHLHLDTNLN